MGCFCNVYHSVECKYRLVFIEGYQITVDGNLILFGVQFPGSDDRGRLFLSKLIDGLGHGCITEIGEDRVFDGDLSGLFGRDLRFHA